MTVANEVNRPDEWGGAPDPAAYARFLRDVTEALRRVTSVKVLVLNGALDAYAPSASFGRTYAMDSERFMEGMVAEVPDIFERLDGWASHAYPLGPFGEHPGRQVFKIDDVRPNARGAPPAAAGDQESRRQRLRVGAVEAPPAWPHPRAARSTSPRAAGGTRRQSGANSRDKDFAMVEDARFAELVQLSYDGPADGSPAEGWTPWNADPRVQGGGAVRAGRAGPTTGATRTCC